MKVDNGEITGKVETLDSKVSKMESAMEILENEMSTESGQYGRPKKRSRTESKTVGNSRPHSKTEIAHCDRECVKHRCVEPNLRVGGKFRHSDQVLEPLN